MTDAGFRVRGWSPGEGWVEVEAPGTFVRDGWIWDVDAAVLAALEARGKFSRVEVLDRGGAIVAAVEGRRATLPDGDEVTAPALAFLAAALRLELAARDRGSPGAEADR